MQHIFPLTKDKKRDYKFSFGGGWTTHPDLVVITASLTSVVGLAMIALAYDLLGVGALGGWDTVKESVLDGVTLLNGAVSDTFAETETGLVDIC